jgi:hypothetical protein
MTSPSLRYDVLRLEADLRRIPTTGEVRKLHLLGTWVNRASQMRHASEVGIIAIHKNRTSKGRREGAVGREQGCRSAVPRGSHQSAEPGCTRRYILPEVRRPHSGSRSGTWHRGPKAILRHARAGFPDFSASVEDLFAEGDRVAIRFTFRGTHQGEFMDISPPANR